MDANFLHGLKPTLDQVKLAYMLTIKETNPTPEELVFHEAFAEKIEDFEHFTAHMPEMLFSAYQRNLDKVMFPKLDAPAV